MKAAGQWSRLRVRLRALPREEGGQVLPMVCVSMIAMLGMAAFALDLGRAMYTSRQLQATTDASALAAAQAMPNVTSVGAITGGGVTGSGGVAGANSAVTGAANARASLPSVTESATLKCLTTLQLQGIPCVGSVPYNAVQVTQTSALTTFFGGVIGRKTVALSSMATAAIQGGSPQPSNIAIIMDTTLSMNTPDTNCVVNGVTQTQMQCALNGVQVLLKSLSPCGNYQTACASGGVVQNPFDQVSLFTFPNVTTTTASIDTNCTSPVTASVRGATNDPPVGYIIMPPASAYLGIPTAAAYTFPATNATSYSPSGTTYQITGFLADYRLSNSATTLNANSDIVQAAGGASGCGGMLPSNFDGVYGTYYAGVIYAAQAALVAQHSLYPNAQNVMIILSDGDSTAGGQSNGTYGSSNGSYTVFPSPATSGGYYPSWYGQCGQAITAAKAATAAGTLVYTVGYGSEPTGCTSDTNAGSNRGISPCDAMAAMASAPQTFYSDYNQSAQSGTGAAACVSSQPYTALSEIFGAIASNLTEARLIPNNTT